MRALGRRALACAATATAGIALCASAAQAQRAETTGDGIPTGQMGTQMFNYGNYISSGGRIGDPNPIGDPQPTTPMERVERLFEFLQSKGVTNIELFGHSGFPASDDIEGLHAYRALMDEYGLHAGGWHGSMSEAGWDERVAAAKILGADYIGSGGVGSPGIDSYADTLATAATLNRLGKKSVEGGVGPAYIHNHTGEFDAKYMHDGELMTAYDILMTETDPRYVAAELDVFWSSDAFDDVTGEQSAALIEKWYTPEIDPDRGDTIPASSRVQLLHIKDGINVVGGEPGDSRSGDPEATGTGEVDFRPILEAAKGKVSYLHHEHDGGTLAEANISFDNLIGQGEAVVPMLLAVPPTFEPVRGGEVGAPVAVTVENTGAEPLAIEDVSVAVHEEDEASEDEFSIVSENCSGATLPPGELTDPDDRGTCTVNVAFAPTRGNAYSVARLQFESNADDAVDSVLLAARSSVTVDEDGNPIETEVVQSVGGEVPGVLSLAIPDAGNLGVFAPGIGRDYLATMTAEVAHTAGDATLSVTDESSTATGHLVNGAYSLEQPLSLQGSSSAGTGGDYAPLSGTAGAQTPLVTWDGPVAQDDVTIGVRQSIGSDEGLRRGAYNKTLTFSLSTATP